MNPTAEPHQPSEPRGSVALGLFARDGDGDPTSVSDLAPAGGASAATLVTQVRGALDSGHSGGVDQATTPSPNGGRTATAVVRDWYRPLLSEEPWRATVFLLASALISLVWLVAVVVMMAISLPLVLVAVGIPLVVGAFAVVNRLAGIERGRAAWVGYEVRPAELGPARRGLGGVGDRFKDPVRWRILGYFVLAPIVFWLLLTLALVVWLAPLYLVTLPLWAWAVDMSVIGMVVAVLAGLALGGVAPRAATLLGSAGGWVIESMLGPDQVAVMQERVDTLTSNRDEILSAVAAERRRIERNLHDGVQQQLVALGIDLGLAANKVESDPAGALQLLHDAREKNRATIGELRVIGRGLHPAILDDRGLDAALSAVVSSSPVPISLDVQPGLEVPVDVAEAAYFVASEAVSNILKHAEARTGSIRLRDNGHHLVMDIHDDGGGGADPARGTGLAGISARVRGLDGTLNITSPRGGPTVLTVELPHG